MGLFSFSCSQRFFVIIVVVVVVVVEAELFNFAIETDTLEFSTPLITIIMYLIGTILPIQQIDNGGDARREEEEEVVPCRVK